MFIRNDQRPAYSMVCMICGALMNILLNYIFIIVMDKGLAGAALATSLSQIFAILLQMLHFFSRKAVFKAVRPKFSSELVRKILYNGSSEFLTELSGGIVVFIFNITLLKYWGPDGVAAYSILNYIGVVFFPLPGRHVHRHAAADQLPPRCGESTELSLKF